MMSLFSLAKMKSHDNLDKLSFNRKRLNIESKDATESPPSVDQMVSSY